MGNPRSTFMHRVLRRLPGGREMSLRLSHLEEQLWPDETPAWPALPAPALTTALPVPALTPAQTLQSLLDHSQEQTREEAQTAFFGAVLAQLVPDQARMLAALSDGSRYPLINIEAGSRLGWGMRPVLMYISSVGKNAGVQCPELTPAYLQGLLGLGLVDVLAEAVPDILKYELLETDVQVRRTMEQYKQAGRGCRIVRQSVCLSPLGERLWATCRQDDV